MTLRLTLVCHAATEAQRQGIFPRSEDPIDPRTVQEAGVDYSFDRLLCAPERRARDTASIWNAPAEIVDALRDCDFGTWVGRSLKDIAADDPDGTAQWLADPRAKPHGGESLEELSLRVSGWLGHIETGHTLAVTHAAVIRAAALSVLSAPITSFWNIDVEPLSIAELRHDGRRWTIRSISGKPVGV